MKATFHILSLRLWLPTSYGGVIDFPVPTDKRSSNHANLHSLFTDVVNGNVVYLLAEGYEGEVVAHQINKTFTHTYHYTGTKDLATRHLNERADVCLYLTECAGLLKDFTAYYAMQGYSNAASWCSSAAQGMSDYFTSNNYEHAKNVLDGSLVSLASRFLSQLADSKFFLDSKSS